MFSRQFPNSPASKSSNFKFSVGQEIVTSDYSIVKQLIGSLWAFRGLVGRAVLLESALAGVVVRHVRLAFAPLRSRTEVQQRRSYVAHFPAGCIMSFH